MGIHKEIRNLFGTSVSNYIISARTAQGYEQWRTSTKEERLDIISRWNDKRHEVQSSKQHASDETSGQRGSRGTSPKGFFQTRHLSFEERKKLQEDRKTKREAKKTGTDVVSPAQTSAGPSSQTPDVVGSSSASHIDAETHEEFEEAIRASVASTSRGNPDEDSMIERAIRASVRELQNSSGTVLTEQQALDRAIQASVSEAAHQTPASDNNPATRDSEYSSTLEKSLKDSLRGSQQPIQMLDEDGDDEDLRKALAASRAGHDEKSIARSEEEIVLEYVKKQSLLEAEHKRTVSTGKLGAQSTDENVDEDLKRALEESLKTGQPS